MIPSVVSPLTFSSLFPLASEPDAGVEGDNQWGEIMHYARVGKCHHRYFIWLMLTFCVVIKVDDNIEVIVWLGEGSHL
jgi:hypothetical protein